MASILLPLLKILDKLHAEGQAHGLVSLDTVVIQVAEATASSIHLKDMDMVHVFKRCNGEVPCACCQQVEEGQTTAADIWSVGVIALQLLLGCPCYKGFHRAIQTGEMPLLPCDTTFDFIDFLMDCLAPRADDRCTANQLLSHHFFSSIGQPCEPASSAHLAWEDSVADVLLIPCEATQQVHPCRPHFVPALRTIRHLCFTLPSHTARCLTCHFTPPRCVQHPAEPQEAATRTKCCHRHKQFCLCLQKKGWLGTWWMGPMRAAVTESSSEHQSSQVSQPKFLAFPPPERDTPRPTAKGTAKRKSSDDIIAATKRRYSDECIASKNKSKNAQSSLQGCKL